jgi:hypothetical protein
MSGLFSEPTEQSKAMNQTILRLAGRGPETTSVRVPEHGDRLTQALNDLESAERRGDPDEIAYANHRLDMAVQAAREARQHPRDPATGQYVGGSFDGGVRRSLGARRHLPEMTDESANSLFKHALEASAQEQAEVAADPGTTIYVK